jgi:hypothetical protein
MISAQRQAPTLVIALAVMLWSTPAAAQDFRLGGGVTIPDGAGGGRGTQVGGQVQASIELGPRSSGLGVRLDMLYSQTSRSALSLGDVVVAGQSQRTYAAVGGLFYRREMGSVAPYLLGGGGVYGQSTSTGAALGVHGGIGIDYAGTKYHPFVEARVHRFRADDGSTAVRSREQRLVSALVGLRF